MTLKEALEVTEAARLEYEAVVATKPLYAVGLAAFQTYQAKTKEAGEVIVAETLKTLGLGKGV